MNRIEIAKHYVEELLRQRQDIIAAWIVGSVARGEDTIRSDIDLALMVVGTGEMNRSGLDTERDGVYIEAALVFQQAYVDLEAVLNDPFKATHMNDALILYDPSGFVTHLQNAVRPVFMQPRWLGKRLAFWMENTRTSLARLRETVALGDVLGICAALGWFTLGCASVPLLHAGITPSSTRSLLQLGPISPTLKVQLTELEGSAQMSIADVLALEPLLQKMSPLLDSSYGQLGIYFPQKTLWMAQQGHHQEALHALWVMIWAVADSCRQHSNPAVRTTGADLLQCWLQRTGLRAPGIWAVKIQSAETLLQQVEGVVKEVES